MAAQPAHDAGQSALNAGRQYLRRLSRLAVQPNSDPARSGCTPLSQARQPMKIYAVGGAVRDELLGLPVKDRDWVVVGATPEQRLARGFQQVGRDFPVFLHPQSHEE